MKKLLIPFLSILVLVNISFAQSNQQKVDSLKREQVKAEQAKKAADEKLRQNSNEKNYESAVSAEKQLIQVTNELASALETQKAEAEAKAQAKAQAKAEAEAAAKKAAEDKLLALYKKRFPEFYFMDVEGKVRGYILERLKKNPNWNIIDIQEDRGYWVITSTSGTARIKTKSVMWDYEEVTRSMEFRKDPKKFYLYRKDLALPIMQKEVEDQYYKSTGERYDFSKIVNLKCKTVIMSYKDIPADSCYYRKENKSDAYFNTFYKMKDKRIVFATCFNDIGQRDLIDVGDIYMYQSVFGGSCQDKLLIQRNDSNIKKINSKHFMPLKPLRNFKIEDYLDIASETYTETRRKRKAEIREEYSRPSRGC